MEHNIASLRAFIESSSLNQDDKDFWFRTLGAVPSETTHAIHAVVAKNPDMLQWTTDVLRKKAHAMETGDEDEWRTIIAEEKKEIEAANGEY